ncbi:uncharacterized protein LOC8069219 [Sorghum bicolor]|uniref:Exocyst subunit Exo70 family protein n=1 Tax=Sorghum bicolor TaxID=4558 RepID=A0A194YLU6_SORBI|nr:uncharacterized protein LOC8069219 [Sorghum bicolor]KXG20922.1 hypothetical protein SORBI_3010G271600 [Sorghum bicolor]|eukprot:XP_002439053.2 uncharacterized protein LOC8069219 [Sorghum bicolor]
MERPLAGEGLDLDAMEFKEELVEMRQHLRGLVAEFCVGASGNVTAPDRWLSELNVAWLLHLSELGASARGSFISRQLQQLVQSWILALRKINTSMIWACFSGFSSQEKATVAPPAAPEFVCFIEATLWKMFIFAGTIAGTIAAPLNFDDTNCQEHIVSRAAGELRALLDMRDALSSVSEHIMMSFRSSPYVQSTIHKDITDDMGGLLSAELGKLDEAVRDARYRIRTAAMSSLDDDDSSAEAGGTTQTTLKSSPDIHKVTRSVINCIKVLSANHTHGYQDGLIMEMATSLEEKLTRVSQSFPDQSLRFLFLINNTHFIRQQLHHDLTHKINTYIESYLQVSWAPMLKCLNNTTFHCFKRNSPLPKFESEFQMTYAVQKLWKVPDPWLRKRLREAIIEIVVSDLTKYLEDNNRITPGITPQEVEEMLQELFEG